MNSTLLIKVVDNSLNDLQKKVAKGKGLVTVVVDTVHSKSSIKNKKAK